MNNHQQSARGAAVRLTRLTGAAVFLWAMAPAMAAEPASQWGVGLMAGVERKPYRDMDKETRALPIVTYENRWISLTGPGIDLKLPSAGPVAFRLRARYAMGGYEASDSPALTGMDERKGSFWLGPAATWRSGATAATAELLADASGHGKGKSFRLALEHSFRNGDVGITPRVAAAWQDKKTVDYYYGVSAAEALASRPHYEGSASSNLELGVRLNYSLDPKQVLLLDLSTSNLGSSIKDSPIVDRSRNSAARLGYLYRF